MQTIVIHETEGDELLFYHSPEHTEESSSFMHHKCFTFEQVENQSSVFKESFVRRLSPRENNTTITGMSEELRKNN